MDIDAITSLACDFINIEDERSGAAAGSTLKAATIFEKIIGTKASECDKEAVQVFVSQVVALKAKRARAHGHKLKSSELSIGPSLKSYIRVRNKGIENEQDKLPPLVVKYSTLKGTSFDATYDMQMGRTVEKGKWKQLVAEVTVAEKKTADETAYAALAAMPAVMQKAMKNGVPLMQFKPIVDHLLRVISEEEVDELDKKQLENLKAIRTSFADGLAAAELREKNEG